MKIQSILVAVGLAALGGLSSGMVGCASSAKADGPEPPRLRAWDEFKPVGDGDVWLGGQPSIEALDRFVAETQGRGIVINLRTDEEMAFLPYYDRAIAARGMRLVHIPMKGSELDAPEVEAYAHVMAEHDGPVLLHCAGGGRASYLWAMDKMRVEGWSADDAFDWLSAYYEKPPGERGTKLLRRYEAQRDGVAVPPE